MASGVIEPTGKTGSSAGKTDFMAFGDRVRIEMHDAEGRSIFGAIDQKVVRRT